MLAPVSPSPPVTALVPTRNRPRQVREAIASILEQRYDGDIECIVVFDGEPPDHELERDDPHREVRVLANQRTPGLPGARNTAIVAARGDFIAICDDDDRWAPDRLRRGVDLLERNPDCDVAAGAIRLHFDDRDVDRSFHGSRIELANLLANRVMAVHSSTLLVRRAAYDEVGMIDEEAPGHVEDYDWLLRAVSRKPIAFVGPPPVAVIDRTGSMFSDWRGIDRGITFLLRKHPELRDSRRALARLLGRRAFVHAAIGERTKALRFSAAALRRNPLERRALLSVPVALRVLSAEWLQGVSRARGRSL
jgi:glycosyltransferase involved in cell wall biosynthesis